MARRWWCVIHNRWDGECDVIGWHSVELRRPHGARSARLRACIFGRSKSVYFGGNDQ